MNVLSFQQDILLNADEQILKELGSLEVCLLVNIISKVCQFTLCRPNNHNFIHSCSDSNLFDIFPKDNIYRDIFHRKTNPYQKYYLIGMGVRIEQLKLRMPRDSLICGNLNIGQ